MAKAAYEEKKQLFLILPKAEPSDWQHLKCQGSAKHGTTFLYDINPSTGRKRSLIHYVSWLRLKKTRCWVTYIGVPGEDLELCVHLACASHNSRSGEDPINALDALAGRLDFLHERPGLAFLRKLPHSVAGKLITLPDVIVGAVSHPWQRREMERKLVVATGCSPQLSEVNINCIKLCLDIF